MPASRRADQGSVNSARQMPASSTVAAYRMADSKFCHGSALVRRSLRRRANAPLGLQTTCRSGPLSAAA